MSNTCEHNSALLLRNGTSQSQRFINALDPTTVTLHDLTTEDWMRFAVMFSKKVNYFDTQNNKVSGDWSSFFIVEPEIQHFVKRLTGLENTQENSSIKNIEPHLTLFAAFLKLTSFSQKRLNHIPKRHLDFYYKKVLKLNTKEAVPDRVHLLFELAKNASEVKVDKGTILDAGKDSEGNPLLYKTQQEFVVNKAKVASLRSIFHEEGQGIKNAFIANSYDGIGGDFPDDQIRWWPFGYPSNTKGVTQESESYPNLPYGKTGFGVSSPVLLLKEGVRTITFTFGIEAPNLEDLSGINIKDAFAVFFSTEKEWIEGNIINANSTITNEELRIVVKVNEGADPITNYDQETLIEPYATRNPVARFIIKNDAEKKGYAFQQILSKTKINTVDINVSVATIQDIVVENDLGILDASKPFYPFGPQPKKGSNFFIGLPEVLDKNWTKINIDTTWKDKPDLEDNYLAYRKEFINAISKSSYTLTLDSAGNVSENTLEKIVDNEDYFTANVEVLEDGKWINKVKKQLLFDPDNRNTFSLELTKVIDPKYVENNNFLYGFFKKKKETFSLNTSPKEKFTAALKKGFVKLTLNTSFFHDLFPRIFSVALSKNEDSTLIPNAPYTPQIETIKIGYEAQAKGNQKVTFFHEHPFGVSKVAIKAEEDVNKTTLLPKYEKSSLFIGLENTKNSQNVSLLVQTLEGSENPEKEFGNHKQKWSILCNNQWKSLDQDYIIANNTDNFLKSGIVQVLIPKEATQDNTRMPSGYFWIKIENPKDFDTSSQLIDIKTQAVLAQFENNNNNLSHLHSGIAAGTISKLKERLVHVKGVTQPYSSFEGKPQETNFYRRISERLRHKQRAITLWDYEHLILQEFPNIYKVNGLPHTNTTSFLSPGNVMLVVIPNVINKNVFDPYKPRVSKTKLNAIEKFINQLNTLHVHAKVMNPDYEEVKVILKAKFYEGKDINFYTNQLKIDIAKLLSPWAFEETFSIDFGVTLHESKIIDYIEKLDYVDYITDFQLKHNTSKEPLGVLVKKVVPSTAKVILTSVQYTDHEIAPIEVSACAES